MPHTVCLGDSLLVLRPCHWCCCSFLLFHQLRFFIKFYLIFFRQIYFCFFSISDFDTVVCSSILLLLSFCSLLFYKHQCIGVHINIFFVVLVQTSTICLTWVSVWTVMDYLFALVGDFSCIYYYRPLNLGLFTVLFPM